MHARRKLGAGWARGVVHGQWGGTCTCTQDGTSGVLKCGEKTRAYLERQGRAWSCTRVVAHCVNSCWDGSHTRPCTLVDARSVVYEGGYLLVVGAHLATQVDVMHARPDVQFHARRDCAHKAGRGAMQAGDCACGRLTRWVVHTDRCSRTSVGEWGRERRAAARGVVHASGRAPGLAHN